MGGDQPPRRPGGAGDDVSDHQGDDNILPGELPRRQKAAGDGVGGDVPRELGGYDPEPRRRDGEVSSDPAEVEGEEVEGP
ncbi:MAG: hypothetical protein METHAR1v1_660019, partial [Methanothrix sp.]